MEPVDNPVSRKYNHLLNVLNSELLDLHAKRSNDFDALLEMEISQLENDIQKLRADFNPMSGT